ncbi:rhomboid family intramembrane serine protease [Dokdonia sinensis]|uniref:Rhomboid family intramembrane serine protease n=1 Tax=Dokdonia sinensis TaxID=2479847 RepID=A0A3M0GHD8_9FLAO|nr:rhomboid family intramembrane serine protease [Dokdonia sinensis]RMB63987.1 rhomboid family intramembrane serine protease [Dokdonia sinensis]
MASPSLAYQFKTANIAIKLIVINVAVFLLFNLIPWIIQIDNVVLTQWFFLPSDLGSFITQPWGLLTYNFLHRDVWHLLWNMLYLYIFSRFILNLFTDKRLLTVYLLGGMVGGLLFVAAYNLLPAFQGKGYLIGASAAVNAIIVFIAAYTPHQTIRIIMFNVKLWHIAAVLVLIDLLSLPTSGNAGGLMAHLGGAAFGYIYAKQLAKGNDIGEWFERIMDSVASMFSGKPKEKKSRMRTVHRNTKAPSKPTAKKTEGKSAQQQQIDAILDKISKSGYESLSKAEKDFLFKAGKD